MKMTTMAREEGVVPETRLEDEIDALEKEVEQLGREMTRELARVAAGEEERTSGEKRKRTEPIDRSIEKALPRLPTEVWAELAAKIHRDDVMAFALTSKQLREAQQQAGRELVTRLYSKFQAVLCVPMFFTRDWCAWWSRRFTMTMTDCVNQIIKVAVYHGYLDVLKTYWSDVPEDKIPLLMDAQTSEWAAMRGHLEVLKWLRSEGCPWDEGACQGAASAGRLEVLKWLRSEGCPWNEGACLCAAAGGHLEVLKWLRSEGCPWNELLCRMVGNPIIVHWIDAIKAQSSSP